MTIQRRILVVEDNAANLELMVYLLNASGYETATAANGRAGLEAAQAHPPELIVCDVQMPEMDGYEFAHRLKSDADLCAIPLVAVTAFAMVGDQEKTLAAGFDAYIAKPIEPEDFVARINVLLPSEGRPQRMEDAAVAPDKKPELRPAEGRRILFVDNLQTNLDLVSTIFEYAGYEVVMTRDALKALALARDCQPDLIVSDVCMPATTGYEFISAVKADRQLESIPFVFLTSTAVTETERDRNLALGAKKYLIRPIDPERLLAELEGCFDR
ncbi:MAG TPA: response regulator [Woeseiaceae bacterium]